MHALLCQCVTIRHFIGGQNVHKNRALKQISLARVRMFNITFYSILINIVVVSFIGGGNLMYYTMMANL